MESPLEIDEAAGFVGTGEDVVDLDEEDRVRALYGPPADAAEQ
jgi:hypothetical protein